MAAARWLDQADDLGRRGRASRLIQSPTYFLTQSSWCQRTNRFIEKMEMDGGAPFGSDSNNQISGRRDRREAAGATPPRHTDLIYKPLLMWSKCSGCEFILSHKTLSLLCLVLNTTYNSQQVLCRVSLSAMAKAGLTFCLAIRKICSLIY